MTVLTTQPVPASIGDEWLLLRRYLAADAPADERQRAFAGLVERYVDPVYAAARRQLGGDEHLAEDVTQAVFMVLAEKARSIPSDRPLSAWLLKVTGYCAANARRRRADREKHERKAAEMARQNLSANAAGGSGDDVESLTPLLDQGLSALRAADRDALLLKYFERKSLCEVGDALGISEDAAQKRVLRAVEKLRIFFRRRGVVTASAAAVVALLAVESAPAAPVGLAAAVGATSSTAAAGLAVPAAAAMTSSASATATTTTAAAIMAKGALTTMAVKKAIALSAAGLALLAGMGGIAMLVASSGWGGVRTRRAVVITPLQPPPGAAFAATAFSTTGEADTSASPVLTFADAITVQLVALDEMPAQSTGNRVREALGFGGAGSPAPTTFWGADGSPVPAMSLRGLGNVSAGSQPGRRQVGLILSMRGAGVDGANLAVRVTGVGSSAMSSSRPRTDERVTRFVGSFADDSERATVTLGVSTGAWTELAVMPVSTEAMATTRPSGPRIYSDFGETNGKFTVEISRAGIPPGRDGQMVAVLKGGPRVTMNSYEGHTAGGGTATFDCRKDDVEKLLYLSRPFEWQSIDNVAVKPAATGPATAPVNLPAIRR